MANLSVITGGQTTVDRYTFTPSSNNVSGGTTAITAVADVNKAYIVPTTADASTEGAGNGGCFIRLDLTDVDEVTYDFEANSVKDISFQVVQVG